MRLYTYDIETYPNVFTCALITPEGQEIEFEMSDRQNDSAVFLQWIQYIASENGYLVGFNNEGFDYPVIHELIMNPSFGYAELYQKAMSIINCKEQFPPTVWPRDRFVKQLDLFKINHFNNKARGTSLKVLEFNMRSESIEDLPFEPGKILTFEEIDQLKLYGMHDTRETAKFLSHNTESITFRHDLVTTLGEDVINFNDTKIGKEFFIAELEKAVPGSCFYYNPGSRKKHKRQTPRSEIHLNEIIFDYIKFESLEFQTILEHLKKQTITETLKAPELNVSAFFAGIVFQFGNGGMHASVDGATVQADENHKLIDLDVTSYYPSLAIANRIFPEHLGEAFCDIYQELKVRRTSFKKGSAENKMLKLALNGVYGDSNNQFSPFYDPKYTMSITVNGQLLLCVLAEQLAKIPGLTMVQVNTDGLTVKVPNQYEQQVMKVAGDWEKLTALELERADYSRMFIRDVNNYIAEKTDGCLKYKGAYCYTTPLADPKAFDLDWHKNHGGIIVAKAAEAALVNGTDPKEFLLNHEDLFDFFYRAKLKRNCKLESETPAKIEGQQGERHILQNTTRYFVSKEGVKLTKIMPPLAKAPLAERRIGINAGQLTTPVNNLTGFDWQEMRNNIDYDFYIQEIEKLVKDCQKCLI